MILKKKLYLGLTPKEKDENIVHYPVIKINFADLKSAKIASAFQKMDDVTHIVVTSKNAAYALMQGAKMYNRDMQSKVMIAVGDKTACALIREGLYPDFIPHHFTSEGIIEDVLMHLNLSKAHVFWGHSNLSRPLIKDYLSENANKVTDCVLYETVSHMPKKAPCLSSFDEIIFTSPSTVDGFLKIYGKLPTNITLTPIGPITKAYLKDTLITLSY